MTGRPIHEASEFTFEEEYLDHKERPTKVSVRLIVNYGRKVFSVRGTYADGNFNFQVFGNDSARSWPAVAKAIQRAIDFGIQEINKKA